MVWYNKCFAVSQINIALKCDCSIWNMNDDPILILFRPFICLDWCVSKRCCCCCFCYRIRFGFFSSFLHKIGIWYSCCRSFGSHALLTWTLCSNISSLYISFLPLHLIWFISDFNLFRFARKHVIRHFKMQLINQVIAFNVDVLYTILHRPTKIQRQGSNELRFDTHTQEFCADLCRRVCCYYYEL